MLNRILAALKARVSPWKQGEGAPGSKGSGSRVTRPAAANDAPPSLDDPFRPEDSSIFRRMFASPAHQSALDPEQLRSAIMKAARQIDQQQPGYQPIYGFIDEFPAKRAEVLDRDCAFVEKHLQSVAAKHQVRILDVGSNCGYVSMRLAEKSFNVVGLEISTDHLALSRDLAAHAQSKARFYGHDFVEILATGYDDLENIDVVLLLNVVHQFIFAHGLEYTQALIARLVSRVDAVFIEIATRDQYVKHGKDHLLPERPEDVLAECVDVEMILLQTKPRPLYLLKRKKVRLEGVEITPLAVDHSLNANPDVSRKYYTGHDRFLKLYRLTGADPLVTFRREVSALLKLRHTSVAPKIFDWVATANYGAVLMSRVAGVRLTSVIFNPKYAAVSVAERLNMTLQYLEIAKTVHEGIGFQNDLQPHNLMRSAPGRLSLVDFEQADSKPANDPFGLLLWSVFDIWGGRDLARPAAIRSLRLGEQDRLRATGAIYPAFEAVSLTDAVTALVADARTHADWGRFLDTWVAQLGPEVPDGSRVV